MGELNWTIRQIFRHNQVELLIYMHPYSSIEIQHKKYIPNSEAKEACINIKYTAVPKVKRFPQYL